MQNAIKVVIFDFGGVISEEGYYHGLMANGKKNGLDPTTFFGTVDKIIFETGYLTGKADEAAFWYAVRRDTGIQGSDAEFSNEILSRFVLRPDMIASVDSLRSKGLLISMLSDQTNWLEEIDSATGLFQHFDKVFNSFRIHKSKRDATVFKDVCESLGVKPEEALFVDDNSNHINRAKEQGLQTIHFVSFEEYEKAVLRFEV